MKRRKLEANKPPSPVTNPDFTAVINLAQEIVNTLANEGYEMKDQDHWCFEAVLNAVFGKNIWDWWNARLEDGEEEHLPNDPNGLG